MEFLKKHESNNSNELQLYLFLDISSKSRLEWVPTRSFRKKVWWRWWAGQHFHSSPGRPYRLALYDRTGFIVESFANIAKVYDLCDPVNIEAFNREQRVGNLLYPSKLPGTALAYSVMEDFELAVGTDGRGHQTVRRKVGILWLIQKGESNLHDLFVETSATAWVKYPSDIWIFYKEFPSSRFLFHYY